MTTLDWYDTEPDATEMLEQQPGFFRWCAGAVEEREREAFVNWAYDHDLDPFDPQVEEEYVDMMVDRAESAAEDAAWRRGCGW